MTYDWSDFFEASVIGAGESTLAKHKNRYHLRGDQSAINCPLIDCPPFPRITRAKGRPSPNDTLSVPRKVVYILDQHFVYQITQNNRNVYGAGQLGLN